MDKPKVCMGTLLLPAKSRNERVWKRAVEINNERSADKEIVKEDNYKRRGERRESSKEN
jgi:hypothetical protein